jgi:hypothetical protein
VQVGAAQAGPADANDHLVGSGELRLGNLLDGWGLPVGVQPDSFHRSSPPWDVRIAESVTPGDRGTVARRSRRAARGATLAVLRPAGARPEE